MRVESVKDSSNFAAGVSGDGGSEAIAAERRAVGHLASQVRFWLPAAGILGLDLWSKSAVFHRLDPDEVFTVVPRVMEFRRSLNDGAVFGSSTGYVGVFIAASVLALAFVVYLFWCSHARQRVTHIALGLILAGALGNLYDRAFMAADIVSPHSGRHPSIIGKLLSDPSDAIVHVGTWPEGAHPQTFARADVSVRRQGVVRDFLKFVPKFPAWVPRLGQRDIWPWIFNVADSALVVGVVLLLLTSICDRGTRHASQAR